MDILSVLEMYNYDKFTIQNFGLSSAILMENAGKSSADFIRQKIKPKSKILVFCLSGNNSGDGFVVARWLFNYHHLVNIFFLGNLSKMSLETKNNYLLCQKLEIPFLSDLKEDFTKYDVLIDSLLGIGFKGNLEAKIADLVRKINESKKLVFSLDLPSGLNIENGQTNLAVKASYTLAISNYKYGHFLGQGKDYCGNLHKVNIGIPFSLLNDEKPKAKLFSSPVFPKRSASFHKNKYGSLAMVAGSKGFVGAAVLSCRAALKSGVGLLELYSLDEQIYPILASFSPEIMVKEFFYDSLFHNDLLCVGCGFGKNNKAQDFLEKILSEWDKPLILDADALSILATKRNLLKNLSNVLLTPHIGEFCRLANLQKEELLANPLKHLKDFVEEYNCKVFLKSATSVYYEKGEYFYFQVKGNDALAKGGSGDILAGVCSGFMAQGMPAKDAILSASYLIGQKAELLSKKQKSFSILPSDILNNLF